MMRVLFALVCAAASLAAQVASHANERYQSPDGRKALIAGLSRTGRERTQKPVELVAAMNLRPGSVVADVGTGPGFMLPYLSEAVGAAGKVLAEDIFDDFLGAARQQAERKSLKNITFIKGTETDPALPAQTVDMVLLLDTYHHFNFPEKMLAALRASLRPGGRMAVVEYYRRAGAMPGGGETTHLRLDKPDVIREIEANGFRLLAEREHVKDSQYLLILESK